MDPISNGNANNGKLLRKNKMRAAAVVCLYWEEEGRLVSDQYSNVSAYEDHTFRFFPPAPRVPWMPGLVSGDASFTDDDDHVNPFSCGASWTLSSAQACHPSLYDCISFRVSDESSLEIANCVGIASGFMHGISSGNKGYASVEAALLCVPEGYDCVDLSFYKGFVVDLQMENEQARSFPHTLMNFVDY
ncbi:hypothetical protein RJ641_018219 [Dillenia turbinata]|uniref:Uncharacterized protein n=1 Tax=Dillenia turbinata TaxID=194707 RepID=A0AAN8UIK1_9MAGN